MPEPVGEVSHVVVVGASAGGIESLVKMVSRLPAGFPAPVVIAQHISPTRESSLDHILSRNAALPVRSVEGTTVLEPGTVYVVPHNRHVTIVDGEARVHTDGKGPLPSVDMLFSSAARAFGEGVIAVVLSGTGSDGAAGAREVKYAGGTIIIENPETAAYPGMPLSLPATIVDIQDAPERLGDILNDLVTGSYVVPAVTRDSQLRLFLDELRESSGIDFTSYKQPTIQRRIHRRMVATGTTTPIDYIRHVREHPEERQRLVRSFLIKVTEFFRDPDVFAYLRDQVIPELAAKARDRDGELRIWSAGCATGEEAYSLAITVHEVLGDDWPDVRVKIFATDLDEQAVGFARRGIYPARTLSELAPELRDRYFVAHGEDYEARKALRGMIVFGDHDLAQRAPFPRIDLVLCRNVLIYFTPALQRRALQLFAFSLQIGGYLVLGKSESASPLGEYFAADHQRLKVFRRVGERALVPPFGGRDAASTLSSMTTAALDPSLRARPSLSVPIFSSLGRAPGHDAPSGRVAIWRGEHMLLNLPVGIAIIDQQYDVQYINTEARRLLGIHTSALHEDLIHQIRHFDVLAVRDAIDTARRSRERVHRVLATTDTTRDSRRFIEVTCQLSTTDGDLDDAYLLLTLGDVTEREEFREQITSVRAVLDRLTQANEEVIAANQTLSQAVARLRAENDDLMVAAEEVQAATEEVETLNEELQASNEELETLNEELQATVEELNTTNDDLENRTLELQEKAIESETLRQRMQAVLNGLDEAIVVVDQTGAVVVENAAYLDLCSPHAPQDIMLDAEGNPFAAARHPLRRAADGETFTLDVGCGRGSKRRAYTVHVRQVTSDVGERLGVITLRPPPAET